MIDRQEFRFARIRPERRVPLHHGSERGTIIFNIRLNPMADATPIEQTETSEHKASPLLEKIREIIIPKLENLRDESATEGNAFNLARSALLLAEADPMAAANTHNDSERKLVTAEVVDNLEHGYNTGINADKWAQAIALAALRTAYASDLGWFVNNPGNSNSDQSAALMRRNFPELVTDERLRTGLESQPDLFNVINSDLRLVNGTRDSSLWWEKLDQARNLAIAFPEKAEKLDIRDIKGTPGKAPFPGKFWIVMKGMMDKAKNGELIADKQGPLDLASHKKVKSSEPGAYKSISRVEDRFKNNTHAFLVIADSLVRLYPERFYELGLNIEDIRRAEGRVLDDSKALYENTSADKFAFGEIYTCALSLEGALGGVRRFSNEGPFPQKPAPSAVTKAV